MKCFRMDIRREEKKLDLFRNTTIGRTLEDEIESHYQEGRVTRHDGAQLVSIFDEVMAKHIDAFADQSERIEMIMDGKLKTYRFCDGAWEFEYANFKTRYTHPISTEEKTTPRLYVKAVENVKKKPVITSTSFRRKDTKST